MRFWEKIKLLCYKDILILKEWAILSSLTTIGYSIFIFFIIKEVAEGVKNNPILTIFSNVFIFFLIFQLTELYFVSFSSQAIFREISSNRKEMHIAYGFTPFELSFSKALTFTIVVFPFVLTPVFLVFNVKYLSLKGWLYVSFLAAHFSIAINLMYVFSLIFLKPKGVLNIVFFSAIFMLFRYTKEIVRFFMNVPIWQIYAGILVLSILIIISVWTLSRFIPAEKMIN